MNIIVYFSIILQWFWKKYWSIQEFFLKLWMHFASLLRQFIKWISVVNSRWVEVHRGVPPMRRFAMWRATRVAMGWTHEASISFIGNWESGPGLVLLLVLGSMLGTLKLACHIHVFIKRGRICHFRSVLTQHNRSLLVIKLGNCAFWSGTW